MCLWDGHVIICLIGAWVWIFLLTIAKTGLTSISFSDFFIGFYSLKKLKYIVRVDAVWIELLLLFILFNRSLSRDNICCVLNARTRQCLVGLNKMNACNIWMLTRCIKHLAEISGDVDSGTKTIYFRWLNKDFNLKFTEVYSDWYRPNEDGKCTTVKTLL